MFFSKASFPIYVNATFPSLLPGYRRYWEPYVEMVTSQEPVAMSHEEDLSQRVTRTHLMLYKQEINHCCIH